MSGDPAYKRCKCRGHDGRDIGTSCPKLRRADGSWNPRHGTWYFSLELPRGPGGVRRPRMRRGGFASREDALRARDEARGTVRRGGDPADRELLGDYLTRWLASRPNLKPTTRRGYQMAIATYLIPLLGHHEVTHLRATDIAAAFATIREWNTALERGEPVRKFQRHVGPAAMERIRAVLRTALNDAMYAGMRDFNPVAGRRVHMEPQRNWRPLAWTPPRVETFWASHRARIAASTSGRHDRALRAWKNMDLRPVPAMLWTPEQAGQFLDHAADHCLADLFELVMLTGIRRGEACGLAWAHVDLDAAEILIGSERVQVGWDVVQQDPKSDDGWRQVALDPTAVTLLRRRKIRQAEDQLAWGNAWQGTGLVFTHEDGSPLHPDLVTATFERLAFAAGLPPVRLHDLRHGMATYLLAAGVDPKVVQERLGHSTIKLTLDTYTTVLRDLDRDAAATVARMIPRKRAR